MQVKYRLSHRSVQPLQVPYFSAPLSWPLPGCTSQREVNLEWGELGGRWTWREEVNLEGEGELGESWAWKEEVNLEGGCEPWRKVALDNDACWSLVMSRLRLESGKSCNVLGSPVPVKLQLNSVQPSSTSSCLFVAPEPCILLLPEQGEFLSFWKDRMLAKKVEESVCSSQSQLCSLPGHLWEKCPLPQDSHTLQVKSPNIRISLKIWFDLHLPARKRSGSGSSFTRKLGLREVEMGARFTFLMANSWGGLS